MIMKKMTTPQNELYRLSDRIKDLYEMFKGDEDGKNIFDSIKQIELKQIDMITRMQRQENTMNLILKLLAQYEKDVK